MDNYDEYYEGVKKNFKSALLVKYRFQITSLFCIKKKDMDESGGNNPYSVDPFYELRISNDIIG